ncbi:pyrethroid hydrolase Ces2a-like [Anopheles ziemanni]|uniref:pyrethroid hydrolase Ces2a-like n=1 Tax=Anopheles coustani TaxID=139045 RepID=UPI00265ABDD8|nr:pyrethroid hydrolase Ces2a-like [Anopheles coustani]XP_058170157.1 pyrethroid hydrolase Ces2a-like [Anopheles ziemanni]
MGSGLVYLRLLTIFVSLLYAQLAFVTADDVEKTSAECSVQLGPQSTAQGVRNSTFNGVQFCEYLGIRYAKPPVGLLRFADPVFEEPEGHNNYTAYGNKCPQFDDINEQTSVAGAEDCLFLNIFTTVNNTTSRDGSDRIVMLPVLVFIHGGSHVVGSGEVHGVDLLMENDVIVVTINYRLGVFGFLKDEKHNITGNYGLKDQLVALQWIQRYVSYFGGDPNRVTVMGHSAGAGDLSHHLYSDRARGLFQGAILLSGSMLAPWAMLYEGEKCMDNYERDLSASTLNELREQSFEEFFLKDNRLRHTFAFSSMFYPCFLPTLEDHPDDEASYFRQSPHKLVRTKAPHPMPMLMSETSTEFELMLKHVTAFWMSNNYPNNRRRELKQQIAEIFENISIWVVSQGLEDSRGQFYRKMASMANLHHPIKRLLSEFVQRLDVEKVYYLRFQFDGKFGEYKKKIFAHYVDNSVYGAIHGDELGYIFSPYNMKEALGNRSEFRRELSVHIKTVELITNFVKYGNPTPKRSKLSDLVWPSYSELRNQTQYLNVDEEFQVREVEDRRNIYFMIWQIVYECLYYEQCEALTKLRQLSERYTDENAVRSEEYPDELAEQLKDYFT